MKTFEIWEEGYVVSGNSGTARFLGKYEGETFIDAVRNWANENPDEKQYLTIEDGKADSWGCRLFDNEADARKSFG